MPVEMRFADNRLGVVLRTVGSISSKEFVDTHVAFLEEKREALATIRYWYSDYSEADAFDVTSDDLRRLADACVELARVNTIVVVAICAPRRLHFGLSRMWQFFIDKAGWTTQVFDEQNGAKAWLRKTVQEDLTFE